MQPTMHPCGNLPLTEHALTLWYCHHHQAWFGRVSTVTYHSESAATTHHLSEREWGPFDDARDVLAWLVDVSGRLEELPGHCVWMAG